MPKTLYLRNVPDDVAERLERLAKQAGMSTSAFAVLELGRLSRRADNAALLADLPDLGLGNLDVVEAIRVGREERTERIIESLSGNPGADAGSGTRDAS